MGHLLRLAVVLVILAGANIVLWPPMDSFAQLKPDRDKRLRLKKAIELQKPSIILAGNSLLDNSVNHLQFSKLLGIKALKMSRNGSASAYWYLLFKNVIAMSKHKPDSVAFFFRDYFLTNPSYRVTGRYKKLLEEVALKKEPLLDRLAYKSSMNPVEQAFALYSPLFQQRDNAVNQLEKTVKGKFISSLIDSRFKKVNKSIKSIFNNRKLDKHLLTIKQLEAESSGRRLYDFQIENKKSFLPHILDIGRKKGIRLLFVRMKRRRDLFRESQPEMLKRYIDDLEKYLQDNGATLLDFTGNKKLTEDLFSLGDHLSKDSGRKVFMRILAKKMKPLLSRKQSAR